MFRQTVTQFVLIIMLAACAGRQPHEENQATTEGGQATDMAAQPTRATQPLGAGDLAPDFALRSSAGTNIRLADELGGESPLVVIFYPGGDCRQCRELLDELELARTSLEGLGARLLAVGIQTPEQAVALAAETDAQFPVLADHDGAVTRAYGITGLLPGKTKHGQSPFVAMIIAADGRVAWSGPALADSQLVTEVIVDQLTLISPDNSPESANPEAPCVRCRSWSDPFAEDVTW